ncbi:hypothetical protein AB0907_39480 [Streptomyces sp. NPDC006975]|uniref:hypothetical protein n=1 Tax=Streptomyces sp. NPDC006975 TaxID=3154310 RepID=UPI003455CF31
MLALLAAPTPLARAADPVTAGGSADLRLAWREPSGPVAPGESVETPLVVTNHGPATATLPVGRRFPREAAGTAYEAPASVGGAPDDPDTSNNADSVHFVIAAPPPAPHRPARAATAGAAVTAGATAGAVVAAGALVVAGGAVLLRRRSRRAR